MDLLTDLVLLEAQTTDLQGHLALVLVLQVRPVQADSISIVIVSLVHLKNKARAHGAPLPKTLAVLTILLSQTPGPLRPSNISSITSMLIHGALIHLHLKPTTRAVLRPTKALLTMDHLLLLHLVITLLISMLIHGALLQIPTIAITLVTMAALTTIADPTTALILHISPMTPSTPGLQVAITIIHPMSLTTDLILYRT